MAISKAPQGLAAPQPLARLTAVTALAVSPAAPLLAVSGKQQVLLFDYAAGKAIGALDFAEGEVHVLRFSRDGKQLLAAGGVGGESGRAVVFAVDGWKRLHTVGDDADAILAADLSPDGKFVALGGPKRVVKVVSLADGQTLHTLRGATDWVLSARYSPDGLLLAYGDRFGGLHVAEAETGKEFLAFSGHTKAVTSLAWRSDSNVLASASEDGTLRLWDLHSGAILHSQEADPRGVLDIDYHATGVLASAGRSGRIDTWDDTLSPQQKVTASPNAVCKIGLSQDGKDVLSGDLPGTVMAWTLASSVGREIALPVNSARPAQAIVEVPVPELPEAQVASLPEASASSTDDLARKRAALRIVEEAVEKLKDEAARDPKNAALSKAYLQLCEVALTLKTEVLRAEAEARQNSR